MSTDTAIHISVNLDQSTFRRFATFDTFRRQRRWRLPVWFMLILMGFSLYLYLQTDKPQSAMIATVLLLIGIGLPLVYFSSFYIGLRKSIKQNRLPRPVYTLELRDEDLTIRSATKKDDVMTLQWAQLFAAYRVQGAVYLYVLPTRAFLLPDGQASVPDGELWAFIRERLKDKCRSLCKEG